jgi:hypothetical protein
MVRVEIATRAGELIMLATADHAKANTRRRILNRSNAQTPQDGQQVADGTGGMIPQRRHHAQ